MSFTNNENEGLAANTGDLINMPEPEAERPQPRKDQPNNLLDMDDNEPKKAPPSNTGGSSLLDLDSEPTPSRMYQTSMHQET